MSKKLTDEINKLEKKIARNDALREEKLNSVKNQLESPIVLPILLIGGTALGIFLLRKKRFRRFFTYATSLSLAAGNVYRNFKLAMNVVHRLQDQRKKHEK